MSAPRRDGAGERVARWLAVWQPDTSLGEAQSRRMLRQILRRAEASAVAVATPAPAARRRLAELPALLGAAARDGGRFRFSLLAALFLLAALVIALAFGAGSVLGTHSWERPRGGLVAQAAALHPAPPRPRQIQFLAPHGTRIVWFLAPTAPTAIIDRSPQSGPREAL
jgi:hypothetical protein